MTSDPKVSSATVATERPQRYGKQLVSHLTRRATGSWDDGSGVGEIFFAGGQLDLTCAPAALLLRVTATSGDLENLEDVVGRHLVRFGARDELVVEWRREDGTAGTVQRNSEG